MGKESSRGLATNPSNQSLLKINSTGGSARDKPREHRVKSYGIGWCVIQLFGDGGPAKTSPLLQGTPRVLLSNITDPFKSLKTSGPALSYEVHHQQARYAKLEHLIPSECWVGPADTVPGLLSKLPSTIGDFKEKEAFCPRVTLHAHRLRISSMNEIEAAFEQYLRNLCI